MLVIFVLCELRLSGAVYPRGSRIGLDIASPGNMLAQGKGQREDLQLTGRIKTGRVRVGGGEKEL